MARRGNGMAPGPEHGIVCLLNDWAGRAVSPQEEKQGKGKRCHSPGHVAAAGAAGLDLSPSCLRIQRVGWDVEAGRGDHGLFLWVSTAGHFCPAVLMNRGFCLLFSGFVLSRKSKKEWKGGVAQEAWETIGRDSWRKPPELAHPAEVR